jgi:hypothetical protein
VIEFLHLDEEIETDQWRQAELTWIYAAPRGMGDKLTLVAWAGQVHKSERHVGVLWRMWEDHLKSTSDDLGPFNETYQRTSEGDDWQERQAARRAGSALSKLEPAERAKVIGQELLNPATADKVMADPQVRSHSREAVDRSYQRDRIELPPAPRTRLDDTGEHMAVFGSFAVIREKLIAIANILGQSPTVHTDEQYRNGVLTALAVNQERLKAIESIVMGGETLDQAIVRIMAGDEA